MKTFLMWKRFLIGCLLLTLISSCATLSETPEPEPTATVEPTAVPETPTAESTELPTSCEEVEGICLELTFDGQSCNLKAPEIIDNGSVTLIFFNESDEIGGTNMLRLLGDKTLQDVIEYNGEEPTTKHHPSWSVEYPGVWKIVFSGGMHVWQGDLEPGIHAIACVRTSPLGAWLGGGFTVEE